MRGEERRRRTRKKWKEGRGEEKRRMEKTRKKVDSVGTTAVSCIVFMNTSSVFLKLKEMNFALETCVYSGGYPRKANRTMLSVTFLSQNKERKERRRKHRVQGCGWTR